jgi:hypothetical protein
MYLVASRGSRGRALEMSVCSIDTRKRNLKDSIRKTQNQKAPNRQCSHLKDSPSCLALANKT